MMQYLFKKIPVQLPKPLSHNVISQLLLHSAGGYSYMKEMNENLPSLKKQKPSKKSYEKEFGIKKKSRKSKSKLK